MTEHARAKRKRTHAEARRSHLAQQARRDALARIRAGEVAEMQLAGNAWPEGGWNALFEWRQPGTRPRFDQQARPLIQARALGPDEDPAHLLVLAIVNRRLRAEWCSDKDCRYRVGPRKLGLEDILGVVLLVDGESPYAIGHRLRPVSGGTA